MSTIIFEPLVPEFHGSVLCAAAPDWVIAADALPNSVVAIDGRVGVRAESFAHADVLCAPPAPWVVSSDVAVTFVFGVAALDSVYSSSIAVEPTVNVGWGISGLESVVSEGSLVFHGTILGYAARDLVSSSDYITNGVFALAPSDGVQSYQVPDYVGEVFIQMTPGYLYVHGSAFDLPMGLASGNVVGTVDSDLTVQAFERPRVRATLSSSLTGVSTANEVVRPHDAADVLLWLIAEAEAAASDSAEMYLDMLLEAADIALVLGLSTSQFNAMLTVAVLAEAHDAAAPIIDAAVEDALAALDDAAINRIALVLEAMSTALIVDEAQGSVSLSLFAFDEAALTDETASSLEAVAAALDSGQLVGIARFGADVYAMYAMTLSGALVSEYDLQVNSQATIGGRTYAATPDGLFLLEGDDDDGAPIVARLRKGWTSLGTQFKKQVANAYLGYTSDGQIRLKVSTTDNTNAEGHSVVYAVNKVAKRTIAENRIDMAKGRHSVYWDFEIGNVMGSDFELNVIKVWRLALNRRK